MSEFVVKLSQELGRDVEELPELKEDVREFIKLKVLEHKLKQSRRLNLLLLKAQTSKSVLSEEEADKFAVELGRKIKKGRFEKLKSMGLV